VVEIKEAVENLRSVCYRTLVRSLSNLLICIVPAKEDKNSTEESGFEIYFTTPEAGFYKIPFDLEAVYQRILPIAGAHFAIENKLTRDLPEKYWQPSVIVRKIAHYGKFLDGLGVLPAPFPLREVLSEEDREHLYNLFRVKGISYGNLSARERIAELGDSTFWMTARGVNKAELSTPGKDVLLVKGFDHETNKVLVSVPPVHDEKARVSVDAVEHELIYRTFPEVSAIVHVHAWMEGVLCTAQNFPCGTVELAREVVGLLGQTENPSRTAVGLKNHGLTITGKDLDEIFARIQGKLLTQVPMFA
jgi:ribulose-5-phosphate 4-epimerase/fuculose-1-phosphate aldolase